MESEMKLKGERCSMNSLMGLMGWTHAKTLRLVESGMPVLKRGGFTPKGKPIPWEFDSARCAKFAKKYAHQKGREKKVAREAGEFLKQLHPDDPRHRFAMGQAQRLEQLHHKESGETLTKADAVAIADEIFGMIRDHFGKLPASIVQSLGATGEKAAKVERILQREVADALSGLDARAVADIETPSESESELA